MQDSPSDFRRVLAQIEFYDIPRPQLDVEVSIVELTEIDQTSLGLDWDAWKTALSGAATGQFSQANVKPDTGGEFESQARSLEGLLSIDATTAARFLNYLVDKGKARIVVRTNVTVANDRLSTVASGTDIPVINYTFNKDLGKSLLTRTTTPIVGEGLVLALVPTIAMEAALLDVNLALRSPAGIDKTGVPIYSEQEVTSQLTLEQNQLYRLGAICRGVDARERKGIPLLKEIPVIKYLFSNETRIIRHTELYVFLKPVWTAPQIPEFDSMQSDKPLQTKRIEEILMANPNIAMSAEDVVVLDNYFDSVAARKE